jgi:hypothetical protein
MDAMAWALVVAVLSVLVGVAFKSLRGTCPTDDIDDSTEFVAAMGGRYEVRCLKFVFPETLPELVHEFNRLVTEYQKEEMEFDRRIDEIYFDLGKKQMQVPNEDGSPETILERRTAQKVADQAFSEWRDELALQKQTRNHRKTLEDLVAVARATDNAKIVLTGEFLSECSVIGHVVRECRRLYRIPDGRYYVVVFVTRWDREPEIKDIRYWQSSQHQWSDGEIEAMIADQAARAREVVVQA